MKFSFDILFMAIIAATTVGCFLIGEEKSQRLMIGTIVGIAASTQLAEPLYGLIQSKTNIINLTYISIGLLVLPIIVCMVGKNTRNPKYPKSKIKALLAGFISSFAAISYSIAALSKSSRTSLVTEHNLAALAFDLRYLALGMLILWLMVMYLSVGKAKR